MISLQTNRFLYSKLSIDSDFFRLSSKNFCSKCSPSTITKMMSYAVEIFNLLNDQYETDQQSTTADEGGMYSDDSDTNPRLSFLQSSRIFTKNYYEDVVVCYTNREFVENFRITRRLFSKLQKEYQESDVYRKVSNVELISAGRSLAMFLWFAGHNTESFLRLAGRFNIRYSIVHQILKSVTAFLSAKADNVIMLPSLSKMFESEIFYRQYNGMPGVIGAAGMTHILMEPPTSVADEFTDWRGQTSVAIIGICNEYNKFVYLSIGNPVGSGSAHQLRLQQNRGLMDVLETTIPPNHYLVADSTFPCVRTLLIPYKKKRNRPLSNVQKVFNEKLQGVREDIDRTFRLVRLRFQHLNHVKLCGVKFIGHFIRACVVLHNMSSLTDLQNITGIGDIDENYQKYMNIDQVSEDAARMRDLVAQQVFQYNQET